MVLILFTAWLQPLVCPLFLHAAVGFLSKDINLVSSKEAPVLS